MECFAMIWDDGDAYQVKLLLKLLICIVDTKLLKAVDVERFKAEDKGHQDHIRNWQLKRAESSKQLKKTGSYVHYP